MDECKPLVEGDAFMLHEQPPRPPPLARPPPPPLPPRPPLARPPRTADEHNAHGRAVQVDPRLTLG